MKNEQDNGYETCLATYHILSRKATQKNEKRMLWLLASDKAYFPYFDGLSCRLNSLHYWNLGKILPCLVCSCSVTSQWVWTDGSDHSIPWSSPEVPRVFKLQCRGRSTGRGVLSNCGGLFVSPPPIPIVLLLKALVQPGNAKLLVQ